jgi:hypothetical protein
MNTLSELRRGALTGAVRLDLSCGLTEFPREILDLADTLEVLNLTGNALRSLPDDLCRMQRLRVLFCSDNQFEELPEVLGQCPSLEMVGFRANQIQRVPAAALPAKLKWLILTENRLRALPEAIGDCGRLKKLMLSGNDLTELPAVLAGCRELELLRVAANQLTELPAAVLRMPRLTWLALAGNPLAGAVVEAERQLADLPAINWEQLQVEGVLGEGASGTIWRANWCEASDGVAEPVAVKVFKGAMTSDGLPEWEMRTWLAAGEDKGLIGIKGRLLDHPSGASGLVTELIDPAFKTLAGPPSLESCTRDVYAGPLGMSAQVAIALLRRLAGVAARLHARGILHGDFYAHNVLWHPTGRVYLGDFGAASFYSRESAEAGWLERLEVRAFGLLVEELLEHAEWAEAEQEWKGRLQALRVDCTSDDVAARPVFAEVVERLA